MSVYCDPRVKTEVLHAGTALPRHELDNLGFDPIPEPHHRFAGTGTGRDSILQGGSGTFGE